jgi:hypothetical protein
MPRSAVPRDEGGLRRAAVSVAALAVVASGCGIVEGVDNFRVQGAPDASLADVADAPPPIDVNAMPDSSVSNPESSTPDVAPPPRDSGALDTTLAQDTSTIDAGGDAPVTKDACVASGPEVCTDGIDNDCNGLTDCADPACAAYTCVAEPAGWSLVAFGASARAACPAGYGPALDVLVDPSLASYACDCTCSVSTPPSCTTGEVAIYDGAACATPLVSTPGNDGACTGHMFGSTTHLLDPLPPTAGTCSSALATKPPAPGTNGETCALADSVGAGCSAGEVCVLEQAAPFQTCVMQQGSGAACPSGFPTSHTAGTSLTDTRACAACGPCGAPTVTCTDPQITFYQDPACTVVVGTLPASGLCEPTNWQALAYEYSATVVATCPAGPVSQPTGSATLADASTVCCP